LSFQIVNPEANAAMSNYGALHIADHVADIDEACQLLETQLGVWFDDEYWTDRLHMRDGEVRFPTCYQIVVDIVEQTVALNAASGVPPPPSAPLATVDADSKWLYIITMACVLTCILSVGL
jgi:hypothetical protein